MNGQRKSVISMRKRRQPKICCTSIFILFQNSFAYGMVANKI